MELGPQFPQQDPGRHANGYSAGKDIHSVIGQNKRKPYTPKHSKEIPPPAPKAAASTPKVTKASPAQVKTPAKAANSDKKPAGKTNSMGKEGPYLHRQMHQHTAGLTENMHALVGFQGDHGRTVA